MFIVINTVTGAELLDDLGAKLIFNLGEAAAARAQIETDQTGQKHQPRRHVVDTSWIGRENHRSLFGPYTLPCWLTADLTIDNHFVHLAENPELIAYTQNAEKGAADIQTPIKVGAYLMKYFPLMSQDNVQAIVLEHSNFHAPKSFQLATSAADIVRVFNEGPRTCMARPASYYESHVHPATVYGDSDLAAAYLTDTHGGISARALVWPAKKRTGRAYGDSTRLIHALRQAGYTDDTDFYGAKVRKIECENTGQLVLPYMDYWQNLSHFDADFLMIDRHGEITADQTNGLESYDRYTCDRCENTVDDDQLASVYIDQGYTAVWCCRCVTNHAFTCNGDYENISLDYMVDIDGRPYSTWWAENNAAQCDFTDEWTLENIVEVQVLGGFKTINIYTQNWSQSAADGNSFICRITNERFADMLRADDSWSDDPRALHVFPTDLPSDFEPDGLQPRYFNIHQDQRDFGIFARAAA